MTGRLFTSMHWKLDARGRPVPVKVWRDDGTMDEVALLDWARWYESAERTVARDDVPGGVVSTVFLGVQGFGSGLFETAFFATDGEVEIVKRYDTRAQARRGHRAEVKRRESA